MWDQTLQSTSTQTLINVSDYKDNMSQHIPK